jgi:geranylgeranyl pyrophosphate synthase
VSEVTHPFDLGAYLAAEAGEVDRALLRALDRMRGTLMNLGTPGYEELLEVVHHGVTTGGKRLRPILCAAAYGACGGRGPAPARYDLAAALEMIHAYSLMHDDLPSMDDADLRRGRPTPHTLFGEARTTVAGAALIPAAALQAWEAAGALGCDDATRREIVRELARASGAGGMVGGQALDLMAEGRSLEPAELDALHGLKTGALLAASLRIGALAAGAAPPVREALERYGKAIGLAFQIVDDILDATASAGALGKNPSDREMDKSTYVALHGLEAAKAHADARVREARSALEEADVDAPALVALSAFIVERGY